MRSSTLLMLAAGLVLIGSVNPAMAQPRDRDGMDRPPMRQGMDRNPAERLRQRLAAVEAERDQLTNAIARLDAGDPWEEVRGEMSEPRQGQGDANRRNGQGPRERGPSKLTDTQALELFKEVDPESAQRLEELRKRNPRFADRLFHMVGPRLEDLQRLRESNPALYEIEAEQFRIERQIMHTARSLHQTIAGVEGGADDASVDETRTALRGLISRQVDLQIETQRLQLGSAQDRLEDLRESIDQRVENRDSTIDDRVERIMDRAVRGGVNRRQHGGGDGPPRRRGPRTPDQP